MIRISLPSIDNIRDFGETLNKDGKKIKSGYLIRSAKLADARDTDLIQLNLKHRLDTVIDLRTYAEIEEVPDHCGQLNYAHVPIIERFREGVTHEKKKHSHELPDMAEIYEDIVTRDDYVAGLSRVMNYILDFDYEKGSVLWHCSEGKDRCGIVSMLVLKALDVDEETILADYLETNTTNLPKAQEVYDRIMERGDKEIAEAAYAAFIADEKYLKAAMSHVDDDYLTGTLKIDPEKIRKFKEKILV